MRYFALITLLFLFPMLTFANVVWGGLLLASRMVVWAIPVGLVIETVIYRNITGEQNVGRCLAVVFVINLFSTFIGALGVAMGSFMFEAYLVPLAEFLAYAIWPITMVLAIGFSYYLELLALRWFFKIRLDDKGRKYFLYANILSTLVAALSLVISPPSL